MDNILYFKVEYDGEIAGLFQSDSAELSAVQIAKLKISQPEIIVTQVDGNKYYELLDEVLLDTETRF